jgi:hypothetical protein
MGSPAYSYTLVKHLFCDYSALRVKKNSLHLQQGPFHFEAALVPAKRLIGSDGAVAGNDDGKGVVRQGRTNCTGTLNIAEIPGDPLIGTHSSTRNPMFCAQDVVLERGAEIHARSIEREANVVSTQECCDLISNKINFCT